MISADVSKPTADYVAAAKEILRHAEALQRELDSTPRAMEDDTEDFFRFPKPSANPGAYRARQSLLAATKTLSDLATEPTEVMRAKVGFDWAFVPVLRVMMHFNIHQLVPSKEAIAITDLAEKIRVSPSSLERIFRLAFDHGLFEHPRPGFVAHNELSRLLEVLGGWIWVVSRHDFNKAVYSWPEALENEGKEGVKQVAMHIGRESDTPFFDFLAQEPQGMENFAKAMRDHTRVTGRDEALLTQGFDWESLGEGPVVDLGGGAGHASVTIARAHPKLKLIVQDLPINELPAKQTIPADLSERVMFQAQDFFQPQTDASLKPKAFLLKGVLHDWSDEDCVNILKPVMPYVETGSKIVICERILPSEGDERTDLDRMKNFMDTLMWTLFGAGERSRKDWENVLAKLDIRLKAEVHAVLGNEFGMVVASL
jgi:hypothetical protein